MGIASSGISKMCIRDRYSDGQETVLSSVETGGSETVRNNMLENYGIYYLPSRTVSYTHLGNLASASNMDADTIRMDGEIEASGHNLGYTSELPLAISEFSNSAYYGFLYTSDGGIIDGDRCV